MYLQTRTCLDCTSTCDCCYKIYIHEYNPKISRIWHIWYFFMNYTIYDSYNYASFSRDIFNTALPPMWLFFGGGSSPLQDLEVVKGCDFESVTASGISEAQDAARRSLESTRLEGGILGSRTTKWGTLLPWNLTAGTWKWWFPKGISFSRDFGLQVPC